MHPVFYQTLTNSELWREAQASFRDATGLALVLVRRDEKRRVQPSRTAENRFCGLLRTSPDACEACQEVQHELQRRLSRKWAPQQVCCFAGLTELALPIVVRGEHVATLMGGQVLRKQPGGEKVSRLSRQLHKWGMHRQLERLKHAYRATPVVTGKQLNGAVRLLRLLANQLADIADRQALLARRGEAEPVKNAKQFASAHFDDAVSLRAIAAHVHLSRNHFCRVFKKAAGMTFTEYISRVRVEKAKALLADSGWRIHEVAEGAGFKSISQFNRVFRRYATLSPTAYRASLAA